jgi:outer membrane immunogenic protein
MFRSDGVSYNKAVVFAKEATVKNLAALCAIAVSSLAGPTLAAEIPAQPILKAVPAVRGWSGCSIGMHIGGAWGKTKINNLTVLDPTILVSDSPAAAPFLPGLLTSYNVEGPIGGGQLGCDLQFGSLVVGMEGSFSWASIEGESIGNVSVLSLPTGWFVNTRTHNDFLGTVTGRFGWAAGPTLLYAKGGVAWIRDRHSIFNANDDNDLELPEGTELAKANETRWGWTLGAGIEYLLSQHWSVLAEYAYLNFGEKRVSFNYAGPWGSGAFFAADLDQNVHIVKVGANYRFGP